jgi:hypothetical protein
MTYVSPKQLFARFQGNAPASLISIARCQAHLRFPLPADYVHLLQQMNGGEGFIGTQYLMLWRVEDLVQANKECRVEEVAPELFLFGSDGGGEAFAFDNRSAPPPIVAVPFVVCLKDAIVLAPNFNSFLPYLYRSESLFSR